MQIDELIDPIKAGLGRVSTYMEWLRIEVVIVKGKTWIIDSLELVKYSPGPQ